MQEQAANETKLEGTPTFYINGKQLTGDKSLRGAQGGDRSSPTPGAPLLRRVMKLTRLKLHGFKSFLDPTDLHSSPA